MARTIEIQAGNKTVELLFSFEAFSWLEEKLGLPYSEVASEWLPKAHEGMATQKLLLEAGLQANHKKEATGLLKFMGPMDFAKAVQGLLSHSEPPSDGNDSTEGE
jgi:hypothetical protein